MAGVTVEGHAARVGERRHATHVLHVWCKAKAQGVAQGGGHAGGGGGTQGVWRRCAGAVCRHRWLAAGVVQGQPCCEDTGAGAGVGRPAVGWTWVVVWVGPLGVCDDSREVVQKVSLHHY